MTTENPPPKPEIAPEDSERIDVEATDRYPKSAIDRHRARYWWAVNKLRDRFVRAGRVIDYACGTGYGSAMLANVAHEVYGRDKDEDAIRIANIRHSSILVNFKRRDKIEKHPCNSCDGPPTLVRDVGGFPCTCVPFDAVVSIETIEHLAYGDGYGPSDFLREAFKLIIPNGLLVLSTPLKDALGPGVLRSKFHVVEFSVDEINALVHGAGFVDVRHDTLPEVPGFIFLTARRPA